MKPQPTWANWSLNSKMIKKGYKKLQNHSDLYDYMFPTSHDIFPQIYDDCVTVLKKVLKAGNTVLITTKARFKMIMNLIDDLAEFKDQIMFRFTITTTNERKIRRYEPHAPSYRDRVMACFYACQNGWETSISIEPFLDRDPTYLITRFFDPDIVTDIIWLGTMSGAIPEALKKNYAKENLKLILKKIRTLPEKVQNKIRLKDSIRNKLNLKRNRL